MPHEMCANCMKKKQRKVKQKPWQSNNCHPQLLNATIVRFNGIMNHCLDVQANEVAVSLLIRLKIVWPLKSTHLFPMRLNEFVVISSSCFQRRTYTSYISDTVPRNNRLNIEHTYTGDCNRFRCRILDY